MSVVDLVKSKFTLPHDLRAYQSQAVGALSGFSRLGLYMEVGTGKTLTATVISLFQNIRRGAKTIVVFPYPILSRQWYRFLSQIPEVTVQIYEGTPAQRKKLNPASTMFTIMTTGIFRNDYDSLLKAYEDTPLVLIVDEATCIKNIESKTYKAVRDFVNHPSPDHTRGLQLLTGTPITKPEDAYAYIKLIAPEVYRSWPQFERLHIEGRDYFGAPTGYLNLDLLEANFQIGSVRVYQRDALPELPPEIYIPAHYDLSKEHIKLYRRLAEEQLVVLESGNVIDATSSQALFQKLQQIVWNYGEFSGTGQAPAGYDYVDAVLSEIEGESPNKLLIAAQYRMTIRSLVAYLNKRYGDGFAVAINSEVSASAKAQALSDFLENPRCRVLCGQPQSMGFGTDGLQHVCRDLVYAELPYPPKDYWQFAGRLVRSGQQHAVRIRIALAEGTLQPSLYEALLDKDELANRVQGSLANLRDLIYGKAKIPNSRRSS